MNHSSRAAALPWETMVLALIGLADLIATVLLVHGGHFAEGNPILGFYMKAGLLPFAAVKALLTLGPLAVLEILRPRSPQFITGALRVGIAAYVAAYVVGVCQINAHAIGQWVG